MTHGIRFQMADVESGLLHVEVYNQPQYSDPEDFWGWDDVRTDKAYDRWDNPAFDESPWAWSAQYVAVFWLAPSLLTVESIQRYRENNVALDYINRSYYADLVVAYEGSYDDEQQFLASEQYRDAVKLSLWGLNRKLEGYTIEYIAHCLSLNVNKGSMAALYARFPELKVAMDQLIARD